MVSSISPTLIPQPHLFPFLISKPQQPHPTPIPRHGSTRFSHRRDLKEEADTLSDEEMQVEEMMGEIRVYGHNFLIPLGKHMTLDEETADVGEPSEPGSTDTTESQARSRSASASQTEAEEVVTDLDEGVPDLDADIPDEDEEGETSMPTHLEEGQSLVDDEMVDEGL